MLLHIKYRIVAIISQILGGEGRKSRKKVFIDIKFRKNVFIELEKD